MRFLVETAGFAVNQELAFLFTSKSAYYEIRTMHGSLDHQLHFREVSPRSSPSQPREDPRGRRKY